MKRLLGLDYGDKTIGVAVSDILGITAQSVETIRRENSGVFKPVIKRLGELIHEYGASEIVLGYPKNMNNTQGERCAKTDDFKARLERSFKLPVHLWDERLSTMAVSRALIEADMRRDKRKAVVDKQAAAFILQGYLDFAANRGVADCAPSNNTKDNGDLMDTNINDFDGDFAEIETLIITDENGVETEHVIIDTVEMNGASFILVVDSDHAEDDESEVFVLKQVGEDEDNFTYEEPTDEEFEAIAALMSERADEFDIEAE